MTIESNRTIGGIGACLFVIGVVSQIISLSQYALRNQTVVSLAVAGASGIISLLVFVGLILFFIAMHGFSKDYSETRIFDNILYGLIITIVLGLIAVVFAVALFIANASNLIPIITSTPASQTQISSAAQKTALPLLPVFAVVGLVWIVFNVRSLNLLGDKSKVPLFRTGAKVLPSRRSPISRHNHRNRRNRHNTIALLRHHSKHPVGSRRLHTGRSVADFGNGFFQNPSASSSSDGARVCSVGPSRFWANKILLQMRSTKPT